MNRDRSDPPARGTLPMPSGWFRICLSEELKPGRVSVFAIHGREVVAFRGLDGAAAVVDPICPHMGAHLGHGGRVVGEALRCPFHGLRFDRSGRCVGQEYPGKATVDLSLRTWPVIEQLGCLFVYAGRDDGPPPWIPPIYDMTGWTPPRTKVLQLRGHIQDIAENAVDFNHFAVVHGYTDLQDPTIRVDGPRLHSTFGFARQSPFLPWAKVRSVFDADVHGLGLSVTDLQVPKLGMHYRVIVTATQLDRTQMSLGIGVSARCPPPFVPETAHDWPVPWGALTRVQARFIHRYMVADVLQDEPIWAHRVPLDHPVLIPGDGPIGKFRRWVRQFYP